MAEARPTQGLRSSLTPATANLLVDDQADDQTTDSRYVSNNRLRPNLETIAAMQAARLGEVQSFASIDALLGDLDAAD